MNANSFSLNYGYDDPEAAAHQALIKSSLTGGTPQKSISGTTEERLEYKKRANQQNFQIRPN